MKKRLSFMLAIAVLTLSACNGASEGQVIDLTTDNSQETSSYQSSEEIDKSNDVLKAYWVDAEEFSRFTDSQIILNQKNVITEMSWNEFEKYSDDWYFAKYCTPLISSMYFDFTDKGTSPNGAFNFAWYMHKYYMDFNDFFSVEEQLVAFPSEVVDAFYSTFFGMDELKHPVIDWANYDTDISAYLVGGAMAFGGPFNASVERVDKHEDGSVAIYIGVFDFDASDDTPTNYYCVTVKDNDDGQTWRYIEGREYFPGGESDPTPDPEDTPELTTSSES